jgi:hypothetical protein
MTDGGSREEFGRDFGNDIDDGRIIPTWIKNENIHAFTRLNVPTRRALYLPMMTSSHATIPTYQQITQ